MRVTREMIVRQMMRAVMVSCWRPDEGDEEGVVVARREKESVHRIRSEVREQISLIDSIQTFE